MKLKPVTADWTLSTRRRCAKWCGRGCTEGEYRAAQLAGRRLAERLGPGWTYEVHENLGWHYRAISPCGRIKVIGGGRHYTAFLGAAGEPGGTWAESGSTPRLAVIAVVHVARAAVAPYLDLVHSLPRRRLASSLPR